MKNLITFSVEKLITVLMVVVAVAVFGVVSFTRLTTDLFPDINLPFAVVTTTYPGASPEEVESDVTIPLERAFQTTTNINEVTTQSNENFSMVMLEFGTDTDMDSATLEMREQINNLVDDLPEDASNPSIMRLNPDMLPIMNFSVSHQGKNIEELTDWVDNDLTPELERISGVASLNISGGYESELRVTLDQDEIDAVNDELAAIFEDFEDLIDEDEFGGDLDEGLLNKDFISGVLQAQNFGFPAGFLEMDDASYMVRVGDEFEDVDAMRSMKLLNLSMPMMGDVVVELDDVAEIEFVDQMDQQYSKVNGENALSISLQKGSEFATTDVTNEVNRVLGEIAEDEDGFEYTMLLDQGEYIEQATGSVVDNLVIGGLLAIAILLLFLRSFRITFVVGVAIPISLLFAIVLIYLSGITLNIVSLGGLALGIGMLVDNSIVVIENIFRMKKEGASNKEAAINGAHQVSGAIIASTLTTIGVFLPVMFIEDFIREIFYQLALTITFSLLASLLIALTFVPTVANRIMREDETARSPKKEKTNKTPFIERIKNVYTIALSALFKVKSVVMITVFALFIGAVMLATSRGFEFFPATDEGTLMITLEPAEGESAMDFETLSDHLDDLGDDILAYDDVESVGITVGGGGMGMMMGAQQGSEMTANANVVLREDREMTTQEVNDLITQMLETDYAMFEVDIMGTEGDIDQIVGSGIQVRISGPDLDALRSEADNISALLRQVEGVETVDPGYDEAAEELRIVVDKDEAIANNLTVAQVYQSVSDYLSEPSAITTIQHENRTYDVFVYDEDQTTRREIDDLDEIEALVVGEDMLGGDIVLGDLADVSMEPGFSTITRHNGARSLTVDAQLTTDANASLVSEDVETVLDDYDTQSGYQLTLLGESEEIEETLETMLLIGGIGIMLVYMIMASQFQSFIYPFIIMITIPLAFTGGFGLLYLSGDPVSIIALLGLVILSGVVVNNGIVLVDYINQLRARGLGLKPAIFQAGRIRIRPIFMTALTTILALTGMAFGLGEGAELIQPLAFTAIGGLVYATFLTIFVVPIMYYALTVYTRFIVGGFMIVLGLAGSFILYDAQEWLFMSLTLVFIVLVIALMVFLPKQPIESYDLNSTDKQEMDEYLQRMME